MPSVMQIVVASTLLALNAAASAVQKRSAFTIRQIANPDHVKNGPAAYAKALAKFGAAPEEISAALTTPGTVTVNPRQYDSEFLCPVTIGEQTFSLILDTASADLWVFGPEAGYTNHPAYIPGPTAKKLRGATWSIFYESQANANGIVYQDTVTIGGSSVRRQAVEVATFSTPFVSDGILGLAFSHLNTVRPKKQKNWIDSAAAQGMPAIFAADLIAGAPGYYDFGALNSSYSDSHITYINVDTTQNFWQFNPDFITIGSGPSFRAHPGIIDTGSTLMMLEMDLVTAYYSEIESSLWEAHAKFWFFPCSTILPDFTVTINGYKAVVPGSYINYAPADTTGDYCYGGIQNAGDRGTVIYGDVFIKSQYVVFDQTTGSPRIGFTPKVQRTQERKGKN